MPENLKLFIVFILISSSAFFYFNTPIIQKTSDKLAEITSQNREKISLSKKSSLPESAGIEQVKTIKIPILMYHYVEYNENEEDFLRDQINIEPHVFKEQVKTLKDAGYTFITPNGIPYLLKKNPIPTEKMVILSFDDGYRDFYTDVFPILKENNVRAVIYVVSNFIGKENYMYEWQIQEISRSGLVELASHTQNHRNLTYLNYQEQLNEMTKSKSTLKDTFGLDVVSFAYPYGAYDKNSVKAAKQAGYTNAVTTENGKVINDKELFKIKRIRPGYNTGVSLLNLLN